MFKLLIPWSRFLPSLALFLMLACVPDAVTAVPQNTNKQKTLQTLLQRWIGFSFLELIPGKLPEKLPVQFPLPPKAQIVGTIIISPNNFQIILDTPISPEEIETFYQQQLLRAGWQKHAAETSSIENRGFLTLNSESKSATNENIEFCSWSNKAKLNIQASYHFVSSTEIQPQVKLDLQTFDSKDSYNAQCAMSQPSSKKPSLLLPPLAAPLKARSTGTSTLAGDQAAYSYTLLNTELNIQALAAHYATQLEQAGWKQLHHGQTGQGIWSTWTFKDQQGHLRQGLLSISALAGTPNKYIAYFSME